jgi:hypothetical protein
MNKNKKYYVLAGVTFLVIGVSAYFIFRKRKNKIDESTGVTVGGLEYTEQISPSTTTPVPTTAKPTPTKPTPTKPTPTKPTTSKPTTPTSTSGGYKKFKVNTKSGSLNVRKSASASSDSIGSLPKNAIIQAKPSSVSGWHEYSSDGKKTMGFVSSNFLLAV